MSYRSPRTTSTAAIGSGPIDAAVPEGLSVEARALAVRLEDEIFKALKNA